MASRGVARKLAAILAADVAGYGRLMGADEAGTLAALKAHRAELIEPTIAEHGGRIVKLMGDGALVEFASVVEAVACAVAIQRGMRERNAAMAQDRRIALRIGINLGDVIVEGEDIYGDGVNVAARLESLAAPAGICVSGDVYRQVRNRLDLGFEDLGERELKNIAEPVRVYRLEVDETRAAGPAEAAAGAMMARPAVAVLPFTNMSGDPEQEYFSDGLAEDIISALAAWRSFPVIARNSTYTYKNKAADVKRVARDLGARYVVEGSVRKSGNRVRITAQFIDGETGHHVWAEKYDRQLDDIFALQDEISQRITATIAPALGKAELKRSAAKRPADLTAWDYYLRGMAFIDKFTKEGNAKARRMFARAIEFDPDYSEAYTGLALSHNRDVLLQCSDDRERSMAKALEAAHRAVALDGASSTAHQVLSTAHIWRNEHDFSLAEALLAVELNPNDAVSLHALGNKSDLAGDPEGIPRMIRAQQLNPQDPERHTHLSFLARAYVNAHQYERALETARLAIQRRPDYPHAHYILAIALGHLGEAQQAQAALKECERLHPGFLASRAGWHPYTDETSNRHLREGLRKAGHLDRGDA
jgi:adenylate cyclase